jgi:hypothetical protein
LGIKKVFLGGKGPENEIIIILPIIGFTGISGYFFSQGLPKFTLLNNIVFYVINPFFSLIKVELSFILFNLFYV